MNNTAILIKKIRADATLGKKKHFNAAERKEKYNQRIGLGTAIISFCASSSLAYQLITQTYAKYEYLSLLAVLIVTVLSWVQIYFNWQKEAYAHRRVANKYLELAKKCTKTLSYIEDGFMTSESMVREVDILSGALSEINKDGGSHPTNNKDYQLAREGIESGEEGYTDQDLSF